MALATQDRNRALVITLWDSVENMHASARIIGQELQGASEGTGLTRDRGQRASRDRSRRAAGLSFTPAQSAFTPAETITRAARATAPGITPAHPRRPRTRRGRAPSVRQGQAPRHMGPGRDRLRARHSRLATSVSRGTVAAALGYLAVRRRRGSRHARPAPARGGARTRRATRRRAVPDGLALGGGQACRPLPSLRGTGPRRGAVPSGVPDGPRDAIARPRAAVGDERPATPTLARRLRPGRSSRIACAWKASSPRWDIASTTSSWSREISCPACGTVCHSSAATSLVTLRSGCTS